MNNPLRKTQLKPEIWGICPPAKGLTIEPGCFLVLLLPSTAVKSVRKGDWSNQ